MVGAPCPAIKTGIIRRTIGRRIWCKIRQTISGECCRIWRNCKAFIGRFCVVCAGVFRELLDFVHGCRMSGKLINIGETAAITTLNVLSNYIFSINLAQYDSASSQEFKNMV
ncbi:putative ferruginol synthase [Helianthus anomalus]